MRMRMRMRLWMVIQDSGLALLPGLDHEAVHGASPPYIT
jgi:hypothetical protein